MTIDFFRRNSLMISVISLIISFVALFVLVYYNLAQGPLVLKRCQVEQGTLLTPYTKAILEAQNCKPEEIEVIVRRSSNTVLVSQTATDAVAPTKSDEYTPDEFPNTVLIYDANGVSTIDRKLKYFGYDTDKGGNNNISLLSVGDNSSTTVSLLSDYYKGQTELAKQSAGLVINSYAFVSTPYTEGNIGGVQKFSIFHTTPGPNGLQTEEIGYFDPEGILHVKDICQIGGTNCVFKK